jgi:hypothetical protein
MRGGAALVLCLLFFSEIASAQPSAIGLESNTHVLNDREILAILRSDSSVELEKNVNSLTLLRKSRAKCLAQLQSGRIPAACFVVLEMESDQGLISRPTKMNQEKWLGAVCMNRVETSVDQIELAMVGSEKHIPENCRIPARRRLGDLEYAAESNHPIRRFELRLELEALD